MNTFKRLLSLTLALVMTLTFLCSCGDIEELPDGPITSGDPVVTDVPDVTDAPDTTPEDTTTTPATTPEVTTTPATTPEATTTTPATTPEVTTTEDKNAFTVEEMSAVMYATISLNVRSGPSTDFDKIDTLKEGEEVIVTGRASTGWYQILIDGEVGYVSNVYITSEKPEESKPEKDDDEVVIEDGDDDVTVEDDDNNNDAPVIDTGNDITGVSADDSWVKGNGWTYMYNALYKDSYRQVLSEIMTGIKNYRTDINVSQILTDKEADEFIKFFLPIVAIEYTYVRNISALKTESGKFKGVRVSYYVKTEAAGDKMVSELQSAADKVIGKLKSSWSDYEKILYLHDWLVRNCTPNELSYEEKYEGKATEWEGQWGKTLWPNTAYGAIVDGQPTCLGYAKGMFYLLSRAGYEVSLAEGIGVAKLHIWVKVKIDGKWYNIDPTWDDPTSKASDKSFVGYDFFLVTDKYMKQTRSEVYDIIFFDDPECTSTKYNWYIYNDYYAESYKEAYDILKKQAKKAAKNGEEYLYLRCANEDVYEEAVEKLLNGKYGAGGYQLVDILTDVRSETGVKSLVRNSWTKILRDDSYTITITLKYD